MFKKILFSIDILNREYCSGWCFHRIFRKKPVKLSFYQSRELIGETWCNLEREDLLEQNLHPTGLCGFQYRFPDGLEGNGNGKLGIHANGANKPIVCIEPASILDVFSPKDPIFFMHIPKTAGTSFNNHIRQYFGFERGRTHIEALDFDLQKELAGNSDYLAGHITLEHIRNIYDDNDSVELHSVVREPLAQLHSHLAWIKGIALDRKSEFFSKHASVIRDLGSALFDTDMSRPAQLKRFVDELDGFQIDFFDNIQTRYFLDYRPDRVGAKDLENALFNVKQFTTVGVTERYQDYVKKFCGCYGLAYRTPTTIHNPAKVDKLFDAEDPEIRAAIDPLVMYDKALYKNISATD